MSTAELSELVGYLGAVRVESVVSEENWALVRASAQGEPSPCPACGSVASRVHSNYQRRLQDAAIGGRATTIELTVRRFFCDNTDCTRTTFVEQVAGLTSRYARRSVPARILALAVAFALGGRAGQRLLGVLAMPTGRMSLLRAIRATPEPDRHTPSVLGIDDFAIRKGHVYATILIDITTGRPVDVLPDRDKETVAAWLRGNPGVQIVCRDRAGAYAEAVREGAPDAIQVADRWHLWHNLGEAVEKAVVANRTDLAEPVTPQEEADQVATEPPAESGVEAPVQRPETGLAIRTRERFAAVQELTVAQPVGREGGRHSAGPRPDQRVGPVNADRLRVLAGPARTPRCVVQARSPTPGSPSTTPERQRPWRARSWRLTASHDESGAATSTGWLAPP